MLPPGFLSGTDRADMKMMLISDHLGLSWAGESGIGAKEQGACPHLPLHRLPSEQQRRQYFTKEEKKEQRKYFPKIRKPAWAELGFEVQVQR